MHCPRHQRLHLGCITEYLQIDLETLFAEKAVLHAHPQGHCKKSARDGAYLEAIQCAHGVSVSELVVNLIVDGLDQRGPVGAGLVDDLDPLFDRGQVLFHDFVGVADAAWGQRLRAFVVVIGEQGPDEAELQELVRAQLARYKVPREVLFIDELPRNATGKVLRLELGGN